MEKVNKNFLKDSHFITELNLCSVRLIDNSKFPWIILIPKRKNITDIFQLKKKDQNLLMKEIVHSSKIMKKTFKAFNLNIEKIGNIVSQLHIHIIARSKKDSSWPLSVWVVKKKTTLNIDLNKLFKRLKKILLFNFKIVKRIQDMIKINKKKLTKLKAICNLAINEKSKELISKGKKVYRFGFGQSPFPVPKKLLSALKENADKKAYLPMQGLPELREQFQDI